MDWLPLVGRLFLVYVLTSAVLTVLSTDWSAKIKFDNVQKQEEGEEENHLKRNPVPLGITNPSLAIVAKTEEKPNKKSDRNETFQTQHSLWSASTSVQQNVSVNNDSSESAFRGAEYYHNLMAKRRHVIDEQCRSVERLQPAGFSWRDVIFMKQEKIVWCPIFKAGSTSWIDYLFTDLSVAPLVSEWVSE